MCVCIAVQLKSQYLSFMYMSLNPKVPVKPDEDSEQILISKGFWIPLSRCHITCCHPLGAEREPVHFLATNRYLKHFQHCMYLKLSN